MHGREVERGGLMDVDVKAVVGLHLECGLDSHVGERRPRPATVFVAVFPQIANFRESALRVVVFLCVQVARNPPSGVVASHGKLRHFLFDPGTHQGVLDGELIAEAETIVIETKTDFHYRSLPFGGVVHALH